MLADGSGLYLECQPSGVLSWRYRFTLHGNPCKINLGRYPAVSLTEARQRRTDLARGIAEGKSPSEQRKALERAKERGETLKEFSERYLKEIVARRRRDPLPILRYFEREIWPALGHKPMQHIEVGDLRALIFAKRERGKLQAALALRNLLKRLWDYAIVCEVADRNLLAAIPAKFVASTTSRSRALTPHELGMFLRALDASKIKRQHKIALQLILLTLTRKGELRTARWEHIDLAAGEWAIPQENSKTGLAQIVYLSRQAAALFAQLHQPENEKGCIFPAINGVDTPMYPSTLNHALASIKHKIQHFTVHDLRRSAATNLAEQEYPPDVIEKALNHKIKGVRGVYNRAAYAKQRAAMLQSWADCLDQWKTGEDIERQSKVRE